MIKISVLTDSTSVKSMYPKLGYILLKKNKTVDI